MKYTNRQNLPEAIVRAVIADPYNKGACDFSVTELIKPSRQRALQKLHAHDIEEDVADRLWSLYGQLMHNLLERANGDDLAEKRFFGKVGEYTISAQVDTLSLKESILTDYKFQTAYKFKVGQKPEPDWLAQLNCQAELLRQNGIEVKGLKIVGLIRDFSKRKARTQNDFPKSPIVSVNIPMWSREQTISFMMMRIASHLDAEKVLPECDVSERWAEDDKYAVMKKGRKNALALKSTKAQADEMIEQDPNNLYLQVRPAVSTRCEDYCSVAKFCTQFKRLKNSNANDSEEETA